MIHITLPDGSIRSFEENLTVLDVAKDISEGIRTKCYFGKV